MDSNEFPWKGKKDRDGTGHRNIWPERRTNNLTPSLAPDLAGSSDSSNVNKAQVINRPVLNESCAERVSDRLDHGRRRDDFPLAPLIETFKRQGAIPKHYNVQNTPKTPFENINFNVSVPKDNIRPDKGYFNVKGSQPIKRKAQRPRGYYSPNYPSCETSSMFELHTGKSGKNFQIRHDPAPHKFFPFYYSIPQNPAEVNILPPGCYLVIPQSKICPTPLEICYHPRSFSRSQFSDSMGQFRNQNLNRSNYNGGNYRNASKGSANSLNDRTNTKRHSYNSYCRCITHRTYAEGNMSYVGTGYDAAAMEDASLNKIDFEDIDSALSECETFPTEIIKPNPSDSEDVERELMENFIMKVEHFDQEREEKKVDEVYAKILESLSVADSILLREEIKEIIKNYDNIKDAVQAVKDKKKAEFIENLLLVEPQFSTNDLNEVYDLFEGKTDDILTYLEGDLQNKKENERRVQELARVLGIFPDIDLEYIHMKLTEINGDQEKFNEFVNETLESNDYPRNKECDPLFRKRKKLWRYYVTEFSVEKYLTKRPDPEDYFLSGEKSRRIKTDRGVIIKYLGQRYKEATLEDINDALDMCPGITEACRYLEMFFSPEYTLNEKLLDENFDEDFLQEVTVGTGIVFITNMDVIKEYIENERIRIEREMESAIKENTFLECYTCYDKILPCNAVSCPNGHICCRSCLVKYVEISYGEGKLEYTCLATACEEEYDWRTLELCLRESLYISIVRKKAAIEVDKAGVPGLEKCTSCDYACIPDPDNKVFTCENEHCLRETCRGCKGLQHIPFTCKEVEREQDVVARHSVEEAMTNKLLRTCPNCNVKFIKIDGCNMMSCTCGAKWCYMCCKVVANYDHFDNGGCPLHSDIETLHVHDVRAAGIQAKEEILKKNPDIQFTHDPTKIF